MIGAVWASSCAPKEDAATGSAAKTETAAPADTLRESIAPGVPFPEVSLSKLDGQRVSSRTLVEGRESLVMFISVDCEACHLFVEAWKQHQKEIPGTLNVLGITDEEPEFARRFVEETGFPFPLYCDDHSLFDTQYGIKVYPSVVSTYASGGIAYVGKRVTPEFTPEKAVALLQRMKEGKEQAEGDASPQ